MSNTPNEKTHARSLARKIKAIGTKRDALNNTAHGAFVMALEHAHLFNNATPMLDAIEAFSGNATRHQMAQLGQWLHAFGPVWVKPNSSAKKKCGIYKPDAKFYTGFNVEGAEFTPFWLMDVETETKTRFVKLSDVLKSQLSGIRSKFERARDKASEDENTVILGDTAEWNAAIAKIEGIFTDLDLERIKSIEVDHLARIADGE